MRKDVLASGGRRATFAGGSGEGDIYRNLSSEPRDESIPEVTPVVTARKKFIPLKGTLLVRRAEAISPSGIIITETMEQEQPAEGEILEMHPGLDAGLLVGDHIVFGKYAGTEFRLNGEVLLLMDVDEVKGIVIEEKYDA